MHSLKLSLFSNSILTGLFHFIQMTNHHKQLSNGCNCISGGRQTLGIIQLTLNEKQLDKF